MSGARPPAPRTGLGGAALAWLAGALGAIWWLPAGHAGASVLGVSALAVAAAYGMRRCWPVWVAAAAAWTWLAMDARLDARLAPALVGRDVGVRGWVDDFPRHSAGQVGFSLTVESSRGGADFPRRLRLTWYEPPIAIEPGMPLELTVRLKRPHGLANPGGFDYERWLFVEDIGATGYVRHGRRSAAAGGWARAWLQARHRLASRIGEAVDSPDARALLMALALGERSEFDDGHWTTLRRTGTSHLVAISGLHVGIVAALLFVSVRRLWLRWPAGIAIFDLEAAAAASFAGAAAYAAMAGFSLPTQRALIMLGVALAALVARRATTMSGALGAALLAVLLRDPLAPLGASFWLSFSAVAVLWQIGSSRSIARAPPSRWRRLVRMGRTQWAVTLGLLPIVVLYFGEVSIASLLVNLVAIPWFGLLLVPATLIASLALAVPPLGSVLFGWLAPLAEATYRCLERLAEVDWVSLPLPGLGAAALAMLFAGSACALPAHRLPGRYLGWLAILAALSLRAPRPPGGALRATVLDVGHGLAVVVRTRAHGLLYDAGARYRSGFDTGRDVVLPALRRLNVTALDALVVSHADNDHAGGAAAVLEAFPGTRRIVGPDVEMRGARRCRKGDAWRWDGVRFEILHPGRGFAGSGNDASCVLKVSAPGGTLLLTGDIEARGERALLADARKLDADVVVVPHHGSATSSSQAFVAAVAARFAVVSAAYANQWDFPRPEIEARWERAGARVVTTARAGAVEIAIDPERPLRLGAERWRWRRPWQFDGARGAPFPGESIAGAL